MDLPFYLSPGRDKVAAYQAQQRGFSHTVITYKGDLIPPEDRKMDILE